MRRLWLAAFAVVAALSNSNIAAAQVDAQIAELNSQALEAYQALDIDSARGKLEQAISMAQQSGYVGPIVAQSYMNLGVVYVAGMSNRDQGLGAFLSAVCMQPDVQLDPLLSTPDVQQVYTQAQQDAQGGACGPGSAPTPMAGPGIAPTPMAMAPSAGGPRNIDAECPPGVKCDTGGETAGPTDFARFFFNVQLAWGNALVLPGMKADSKPPVNQILHNRLQAVDANGDSFIDDKDDTDMDGMIESAERAFFDNYSAWLPDADSFDDFQKVDKDTHRILIPRGVSSLSTACPADGIATGPTDIKNNDGSFKYATIEPSKYCALVTKSGFVPNLAIRLNPGYFLTKNFALSIPFRFQFNGGKGTLSHMLIGLRGELSFSPLEKATGIPISWFFGGTYGQVQAKPPPTDKTRPAPYVVSGPFGLHTGLNFRFRVHRNFGFIVAPEVDVLLPDFLLNLDLSGGVEAAF